MTIRTLRSSAAYVDGEEFERTFELSIPDDADDDTLEVLLYPESGFGHFTPDGRSVDAFYEIEAIDGLEPAIQWEAGG